MNLELSSNCICEYTKALIASHAASKSNKWIKAIFRNLQSDSSHPNPYKRYVSIFNFGKIFDIIKDVRFSLFEFAMTEIVPVCFKNVSQLIVATSNKNYNEGNPQSEQKHASELCMLSQLIIDNIEQFSKITKEELEKESQKDEPNEKYVNLTFFEEFAEYLLQNSISSDRYCRYESQKVLFTLASKYFMEISKPKPESLSEWIIELIRKCNIAVNKRIIDDQLKLLEEQDIKQLNEQNNLIDHLTAQLQGINWLMLNMKMDPILLINEDLIFNIVTVIKVLRTCEENDPASVNKKINEDISRKFIKVQYFRQLFEFLTHCSKNEQLYEDWVQKIEKLSGFNTYSTAIQILLIPHSFCLTSNDEDKLNDEIVQCSKEYIKVLTQERGRRLLEGIKEVKDNYDYIDLTCIDPELPEEYTAKTIIQLTNGYLSLIEIEKPTTSHMIHNLLCDKWNPHLVGCTELWVGNNTSPVVNLKGKILLNFLCQLHIPFDKVCSWLTDKSSDFQKGIDYICRFISSNTEAIEYLVARTSENQVLLTMWIPIINSLVQNTDDYSDILKCFIRYIPREWKEIPDDDDRKADQLRFYSVLSHHCIKLNLFNEITVPDSNKLLTHFMNQINDYSSDKHPVFIKYECLNLIGILYNIKSPLKQKFEGGTKIIGEALGGAVLRIMNQYFPLWSYEIKPDTREKRYYEMIFDGILNIISFSKNPQAIKFLYRAIKEDKNILEHKLERGLHNLITKSINKLSQADFLVNTKILFAEFIDFDADEQVVGNQNIHNNLKFGIVERCLLKIFKTCPFEFLTPIINEFAPKLLKIMQSEFDTKDIDKTMFQLKERGYILKIFEVWTRRIHKSCATVKDFFNAIKVKGVELTKALIKVCHAGSFADLPKIAEGKLEKEEDQKEWKELISFYIWGCWSCICIVISTTQTKESIFEKFLFGNGESKSPVWNLIIPEHVKYHFSVETDFEVKGSMNDNQFEDHSEDEIIKRFNDNFFISSDNLLLSIPQDAKGEENQLHTKPRLRDKVKLIIAEDEDSDEKEEPDEEDDEFELDDINKHTCMQGILFALDVMNQQFSNEWKPDVMPAWMQNIYNDYKSLNNSAKLFVLKLIINRPNLFHNYASYWFEYLAEYMISKDTGGKGLHYFLRDICTVLINFSDKFNYENENTAKYCNEILNCLIKYSADKRRLIFTHNISIIGRLLEKWKDHITELNEAMIGKMLNSKEGEIQNSDLWKMAGIQIIALACKFGIRVNLLSALIKQLEHRKRSIIYASSEVIGVLLANQPEQLQDASSKIQLMYSGEAKQDLFISIVQKISKYQGLFALEKPILQKLLSFLKPFSASFRACILQSLRSCIIELLKENNEKAINEICMCIQAHYEDIICDKDDECQQSFILFLKELVKCNSSFRDNLFNVVLDLNSQPNMHSVIRSNRNHLTRGLYCDLMVSLYNDGKFKQIAEIALIKNIEDPNEIIKNKLLIFWSDPNRLPSNPTKRLLQMMQYKPMFENEQTWLKASVWLMLDLIRFSKAYESSFDANESQIKPIDDSMEVDISNSKEESKSLSKKVVMKREASNSQNEDQVIENSFYQASFGQTIEWSSSFQKDSKFYKSYNKDSFLMSMGDNESRQQERKKVSSLDKGSEKEHLDLNKKSSSSKIGSSDKNAQSQVSNKQSSSCFVSAIRKRKIPAAFSKFFEKNEIKRPISTVGRNKNIRFGPDGVYRVNLNKLKETKKRQEEHAEKERKAMRMKLIMKNRDLEAKELEGDPINLQTQDLLYPLQSLVLLNSEIASSLFYNLFDSLFDREPDQVVKDSLANTAISLLNESVACDSSTISCLLLILLKLCKNYRNIDINAVKRAGIKSLNFSKAILLLEELIIYKPQDEYEESKKHGISPDKFNKSKEWICLKRLHEAADSTGSQNLMLDEFLLFEESEDKEICQIKMENLGETYNQVERKKLAKKYLDQLENSESNFILEELADEMKHNYFKCKSELLEWESICEDLELMLSNDNLDSCISRILIDSCIRVPKYSTQLKESVDCWMKNPNTKYYLEREYSYQLSILSILNEDWMRGLYYIDKDIKTVNFGVPSHAQHYVIQKIMKNYECRQFLGLITRIGIEDEEKLKSSIFDSISSWLTRTPNPVYDPINLWDDIVTSRIIYLNAYSNSIKEFKTDLAKNDKISDIRSLIYLQAATGAKEMALYDSSEKYLRKAVDECINLHSCTPLIVELKIKQYRTKYLNEELELNITRLKKIEEVIKRQKQGNLKDNDSLNHTSRLALLLGDIKQMIMEVVLHNFKEELIQNDVNSHFADAMEKTYSIYHKVIKKAESKEISNKILTEAHMKFATFADQILSSDYTIIKDALVQKNYTQEMLAVILIKSGFAALNRGAAGSSSLIPRMIQALTKFPNECGPIFKESSKATPSWKFLEWKSQILACINEPISEIISTTVINLFKNYPQALFYVFKVVESDLALKLVSVKESRLYKALQKYCSTINDGLNGFAVALDYLVEPEFRWKYWFDLIREAMLREDAISKAKASSIAALMIENITSEERKYIGIRIGEKNRLFSKEIGPKILKAFGPDGKMLLNMTYNEFVETIRDIYTEINERIENIESGTQKLSIFCEWLALYSYSEYKSSIEIPGQYEDDSEPFVDNHIKIASFRKNVLTLGSIRKPKRLTLNGSNEKEYDLLVKGGEDLRLDQRVQQVFKIMNKCFIDDPNCHNRELQLSTFQVVPISNRTGVLEWINNTIPLKELIERNLPDQKGISKCRATIEMRKWLQKINPNGSIQDQHISALSCKREDIVTNFKRVCSKFPRYILREGIKITSDAPEIFLNKRANFIKSYACLCIASYILGIGDRHLENFLISLSSGSIYGIDFGIAFDSGLHLGIPELIPFRLTVQILDLIEPYSIKGYMKHALYALRRNQTMILDTCEIFIKEPLLEWIKEAQHQNYNNEEENDPFNKNQDKQKTEEKIEWYPQKKIDRVKDKLEGKNSAQIMMRELSDSIHCQKDYFQQLKSALVGPKDGIRFKILKQKKRCLEVEEQIDFLIDHATDPNIIGRLWIGWSPYV